MRVNVGIDNFFKNYRETEIFFEKEFEEEDVKISYDTKRRMKKACQYLRDYLDKQLIQ